MATTVSDIFSNLEILMDEEVNMMGKFCGYAVGIGIAGAIVGMSIYMCMPAHDQRHIQRGLRDAVDDLKDIADRLS